MSVEFVRDAIHIIYAMILILALGFILGANAQQEYDQVSPPCAAEAHHP